MNWLKWPQNANGAPLKSKMKWNENKNPLKSAQWLPLKRVNIAFWNEQTSIFYWLTKPPSLCHPRPSARSHHNCFQFHLKIEQLRCPRAHLLFLFYFSRECNLNSQFMCMIMKIYRHFFRLTFRLGHQMSVLLLLLLLLAGNFNK